MDYTVETMDQGIVLDDAVQAPEEPQVEALSQMLQAEPVPDAAPQQEAPPANEPGWIKGRVDKAVRKAIAETEQRMTAQFQQTLAPLYESMMERQADDLVKAGEFRSREIALEYIRMKNGQVPATLAAPQLQEPAPAVQPRDAQGRFTAQQPKQEPMVDYAAQARADMLAKQAERIKSRSGLDVMQAFNANPDMQQKVLSGEWDFHDVADAMQQFGVRRVPPSPMRSPNGLTPGRMDIASMSDEQFEKFQQAIKSGRTFDAMK